MDIILIFALLLLIVFASLFTWGAIVSNRPRRYDKTNDRPILLDTYKRNWEANRRDEWNAIKDTTWVNAYKKENPNLPEYEVWMEYDLSQSNWVETKDNQVVVTDRHLELVIFFSIFAGIFWIYVLIAVNLIFVSRRIWQNQPNRHIEFQPLLPEGA